MSLPTLLFDAGGVLIRPLGTGLSEVFEELAGVPLAPDVAARSYAVTDRVAYRLGVTDPVEWAKLWAASLELDESLVLGVHGAVERDKAMGDRIWCHVEDDVRSSLAGVRRQGWQTGIVSQSDGLLPERLVRLGLADLFDTVVDSALVPFDKPSPQIYRHAAGLLGVPLHRCVYLSDLLFDARGALDAGCRWSALFDPYGLWEGSGLARFTSVGAFLDEVVAASVAVVPPPGDADGPPDDTGTAPSRRRRE
ncbi:HAD family hydrolase [Streptomyces sp. NPDC050433]|uniref:HAD family hydrolase n=1 Tax=unclassified Streptomyces TaxID=2593676 RepID=UPI003445BF0D